MTIRLPFPTDERDEFEGRGEGDGEEVDRGGAQEREGQRGRARASRGPHGRTMTLNGVPSLWSKILSYNFRIHQFLHTLTNIWPILHNSSLWLVSKILSYAKIQGENQS